MAQEAGELPGYQRGEPIQDSSASSVYRARRLSDGACVVVKRSRGKEVSAGQLTRYRNEFELLRAIASDGVVKAYELRISLKMKPKRGSKPTSTDPGPAGMDLTS